MNPIELGIKPTNLVNLKSLLHTKNDYKKVNIYKNNNKRKQ